MSCGCSSCSNSGTLVLTGGQGLTGPPGPQGIQGIPGADGQDGQQGIQGIQGIQGPIGPTGIQGPQGIPGVSGGVGSQGPPGPPGPQGATGSPGSVGATGATGPQGPAGIDGDQYLTSSTNSINLSTISPLPYNLCITVGTGLSYSIGQTIVIANSVTDFMEGIVTSYNSTTGAFCADIDIVTGSGTFTSWTVNLQGAPGAQGPPGPQGVQGAQGPTGLTGATGATGATGPPGPAGATGATGPQGPQGIPGSAGSQGPPGATGAQGPQGVPGAQGQIGPQGPPGTGSTSEFGPDLFGAFGDGTQHIINQTINPATGSNYTQAQADAIWYQCKFKYQINTVVITSVSVGTVYRITIGPTAYSYTAIGGDTTTTIAANWLAVYEAANGGASFSNNICIDQVGNTIKIQQTVSQGVSATGLLTNTLNQSIVSRINVSTDTVDWAAFQHALGLAELIGPYSKVSCGLGKVYAIKKDLELPHRIQRSSTKFILVGNGSSIKSFATSAITALSRQMPGQKFAEKININTDIKVVDLSIGKDQLAASGGTGLWIEASRCHVSNMLISSYGINFDFRFCLGGSADNVHSTGSTNIGFNLSSGQWFGAGGSNAGNNVFKLSSFRDGSNFQNYGVRVYNSSDCSIETGVVEGNMPMYGIFCTDGTSTVCKSYQISNIHFEGSVNANHRALVGCKQTFGGQIIVSNCYNQISDCVVFEGDAGGSTVSMILRDIPYAPNNVLLRNIGLGMWDLFNCYTAQVVLSSGTVFDPLNYEVTNGVVNAANWSLTNGGSIPTFDHVRVIRNVF